MGLSRSRLVALALNDYLRSRRQAELVEQLNQAYSGDQQQKDKRTAKVIKAKFRATIRERW